MQERNIVGALTLALAGANLEMDAAEYSLLDLTQVASALCAGAILTIGNADLLSPIERSCITSVTKNKIEFHPSEMGRANTVHADMYASEFPSSIPASP